MPRRERLLVRLNDLKRETPKILDIVGTQTVLRDSLLQMKSAFLTFLFINPILTESIWRIRTRDLLQLTSNLVLWKPDSASTILRKSSCRSRTLSSPAKSIRKAFRNLQLTSFQHEILMRHSDINRLVLSSDYLVAKLSHKYCTLVTR